MQERTDAFSTVSRRSFLKGSAAALAAGATTGLLGGAFDPESAQAAPAVQEEMGTSFCRCNCGDGGCTFDLHVRDGNIAYVAPRILEDTKDLPDRGRSRACLRGLSNLGREYDPGRILHPMRRVDGTERGAGQWEQITWDEAIQEISSKWKGYTEAFGKDSIANWTTFGNHASVNGETGLCWGRLAWFMGMSSLATGADWSNMYVTPQAIGANGIGPSMSAVEGETKNFVCWGTNLAECYPHVWRYIANAIEKGTILSVVDPRYSATAAKAKNHFKLRPASDTALALGICRYYFDNDLIDKPFLKSNSDAPFLVRADNGKYLRSIDAGFEVAPSSASKAERHDQEYAVWDEAQGRCVPADEATDPALFGTYTVNGIEVTTVCELLRRSVQEWTLEHTAEVCDMTVEDIVKLADIINDGPTVLLTGFGFGHYANGHAMATSTCAVTILTGNLTKPGAGYGLSRLSGFGTSNIYGTPGADPSITFKGGNGPAYSALKLPDIMRTGTYNNKPAVVKSAIVHSANPLGNQSGRTAVMEAIKGLDLLVTVDMYMTDTAMYS
ncbi:MAG: molybdopterin-dependent oxidoreductase, partial [Coriobacteriales bacterium]|nr:molybdopterin-dependent oxidoreductase [Coriobacteriales bacterium]